MKIYSFEKLESWQNARKLAAWVYRITKNLPDELYTEGREKIEKQTILIVNLRKSQQLKSNAKLLNT